MNAQRLFLSIFLFSTALVFFNIQRTSAQTDMELFNRYIEKPEPDLSLLKRLADRVSEPGYQHVSLNDDAQQFLNRLIKDHQQAKVLSIFLVANDTTDLFKVFSLMQKFPNLEALNFFDDGQKMIKRKYQLPEEILKFSNLKFVGINGAQNLDAQDTFEKLRKMPALRGVDLLDYKQLIPVNSTLPDQITLVKLSTPQLLSLNTKNAIWRMAKIKQMGYDDPKDETLLEKLAELNTMEVLDFQNCYVKDGAVFKKFIKLNKLKISPILAKGTEFVKSLSVLTQLKELAIYGLYDTSQSLSDLGKFTNLELLDLKWVSRFKSHPDELISIGKLTKLRSLTIQSSYLSSCPDFFKTLGKLESVIFKWNAENWNQNSSFSLPPSLNELTELKTLIIWKTISEAPSLKKLAKLQLLDLSSNNIKRIPEGITELKYLKTLMLTGNQLKDIPVLPWAKLTKMENLDLSRNQIAQFPDGVQHLHELKFLNLSGNKITSFPALDEAKYQLKVLTLDNNHLPNLPSNIGNYQDLLLLSASNCGLMSLPNSIGDLKQLKELNVERNNLKTLPEGLARNLNLYDLNLKNNREMDEQSIYYVVFGSTKNRYLIANLDNTGLNTLPANAPWEKLDVVLDLSNNNLKTLPVEMSKMKWFNIALKNNPLPVDTGFISRGISSPADAKVLFEELGYQPTPLKVSTSELAVSMNKAAGWLYADSSFKKAVEYAEKAKALDSTRYDENVNWFAIGMARFKTKDYKNAITDLNTSLVRSTYKTWWQTMMARQTEAALAESYRKLGEKTKAAEIHAFFANKNLRIESSLSAALSYLELGELTLSKRYFDSAVLKSKRNYLKYPNIRDIHIYNYAEILLMAEKPDEVLRLFKTEDPKVLSSRPAYINYLETAALLMKHPLDYKKLRNDYLSKIAKNGKVTDWDYSNFNHWIKYSSRSDKEKQQLHELEVLNN